MMGVANTHLLLGFLVSFVLNGIDPSLAAPSLFDNDGYDPSSYLDIFSSDQADLGAPATEDPLDFTTSLINNQGDLGPLASNDQLDWGTDGRAPSLDSGAGDTNFQQDSDLLAATPSCAFDDPAIQGLNKKKRDPLPNLCPNPLAPGSQEKEPTTELAKPPDPVNPGRPNIDHADLGAFYVGRDQDTIRGYFPGKSSDSPCGTDEFTVCDDGDPYYRIPQVPPRYALERCFICMLSCFCAPRKRIRTSCPLPLPFPGGRGL